MAWPPGPVPPVPLALRARRKLEGPAPGPVPPSLPRPYRRGGGGRKGPQLPTYSIRQIESKLYRIEKEYYRDLHEGTALESDPKTCTLSARVLEPRSASDKTDRHVET